MTGDFRRPIRLGNISIGRLLSANFEYSIYAHMWNVCMYIYQSPSVYILEIINSTSVWLAVNLSGDAKQLVQSSMEDAL